MPNAKPTPPGEPERRAEQAEHQRLEPHGGEQLRARGAERAQHAELARALGDRDRERVEDLEGAHEQRHPGEHEQRDPQELQVVGDVVGLALRRLLAGLHLHLPRHHPRDPVAQLLRAHAVLAATEIWSNWPSRSVIRCASGSSSSAMPAPPKLVSPSFVSPTTS